MVPYGFGYRCQLPLPWCPVGLVTVVRLHPLIPCGFGHCWWTLPLDPYGFGHRCDSTSLGSLLVWSPLLAQLDLLVVPQAELHHILDVRSLRAEALASHHVLLLARSARGLIARTFSTRTAKRTNDRTSLKEAQHSNAFAALFQEYAEQAAQGKRGDINIISTSITEAFDYA